jgi:hypothetical protein
MANNVRLPRIEFPKYKGGDLIEWQMNCEYYLDMYQVLEPYKSKNGSHALFRRNE